MAGGVACLHVQGLLGYQAEHHCWLPPLDSDCPPSAVMEASVETAAAAFFGHLSGDPSERR